MEFTEAQIRGMIESLRDDFPEEIATRELALLELEDLARKGCLLENNYSDSCLGCSAFAKDECPMIDWQKHHPEYANDELAMKIKVLEAGGEEAYKEKQKRQKELLKKAEEEAQKATDVDRAEACRHLLNLYYKSKLATTEQVVLDLVNNILYAKTKAEISDEVAKIA